MNSIGFNNFRRFASFPEMDLGDITLLVGGNNSGKSTLVKALLLCVDNIRLNNGLRFFRFDANEYHDVKIKTFARAIHNKPVPSLDPIDDKPSLPTQILFKFTLGNFKFNIIIAGDRDKDEVTGTISYVSIEDRGNMVGYSVNYLEDTMSYSVLGSTSERETLVKRLYKDYVAAKELLETLSEAGEDIAAISAQSEKVASLEKRIEEFVNPDEIELPDDFDYEQALKKVSCEFEKEQYTSTSWNIPFSLVPLVKYYNENDKVMNLFVEIIDDFIQFANAPAEDKKKRLDRLKNREDNEVAMQEFPDMEETRSVLKQEVDKIRQSKSDLYWLLKSLRIEYVTAHTANQNTIYNTADRNDFMAQTVHEFVRAKIKKGEREYSFVKEWMRKFDIGSDFEIISIDGEAYRVKVKDSDGSELNLADKGMGSIQVMMLLLRLATILRIYKVKGLRNLLVHSNNLDEASKVEMYIPTVIIEEPEQNLHPRVQSLLADLLLYLNKEYHCKFIIETHSEYLIRKTQVLVANEKYEDERALKENNPFKVYYFEAENEEIPYYEMKYRTDGKFSNEFGPGFFDTASNLAFELF